jgi:copper(I)-binding protein
MRHEPAQLGCDQVFSTEQKNCLPMRLRTFIELLAALLLTFAALLAISQMAKADGIEIVDPYARATIGSAKTGVAYLKLVNRTGEADRLRTISTDVAEHAALHVHAMKDDVMVMDEISCLELAPGTEIEFAPGGLHVMLTGLSKPLREGDHFPLHFTFDRAGEVSIDVPVRSLVEGALNAHGRPELKLCD